MKKAFVTICAVLPGGFLLLATMLLFISCAYTRYNQKTGERVVTGFGTIVEIAEAERLQADAEAIRAQADATRMCSMDTGQCGAIYGSYGFAPLVEQPWWKPFSQLSTPGQRDDSREIRKDIAQIKESQRLLIKAIKIKK